MYFVLNHCYYACLILIIVFLLKPIGRNPCNFSLNVKTTACRLILNSFNLKRCNEIELRFSNLTGFYDCSLLSEVTRAYFHSLVFVQFCDASNDYLRLILLPMIFVHATSKALLKVTII